MWVICLRVRPGWGASFNNPSTPRSRKLPRLEGAINLPDSRVTVGRHAQVLANITACEVVDIGTVRGNVNASDRVDIRSEGSLTGDVTTGRIIIGDGDFFKGGIDISKPS